MHLTLMCGAQFLSWPGLMAASPASHLWRAVDPTDFVRDPAIRASEALTATRTWIIDSSPVRPEPGPGWGTHRIEYQAMDAASNIAKPGECLVTFTPSSRPDNTNDAPSGRAPTRAP